METNKSVLQLFLRAYELGRRIWLEYSGPYSCHAFTQPQLFACLAVRESLKLSYRRTEAFLKDVRQWLERIGMTQVPDHNTLWRAFGNLLKKRQIEKALDLMAASAKGLANDLKTKPLTMDSTCYEPRHRSDHYDRVCRKMQRENGGKDAKSPGKWGKKVNASRSVKTRGMPKLSLAVVAASHQILSLKAVIGNGSDAPDFEPLLFGAWRRTPVKKVVVDAGFDSEKNHEIARQDMRVRSIIPPKIGRPSDKPPAGRWRRTMKQRFARGADAKVYGQRSQSETVNSMMKRNLGEYLRSVRPDRRKQEMAFRGIVHNLMLGEG
jgi:hypothetical protein